MTETRHRVAIIGCGGHGEYVARGYHAFPETEIVAIAEHDPDRCRAMGARFNVSASPYRWEGGDVAGRPRGL